MLIFRIREVGRQLVKAQPREIVIENIIRRVLGLIREVSSNDNDDDTNMSDAGTLTPAQYTPERSSMQSSIASHPGMDLGISIDTPPTSPPRRPQMSSQNTTTAPPLVRAATSLFWVFRQGDPNSGSSTPLTRSPALGSTVFGAQSKEDIKSIKLDAIDGIKEILDEIDQASDQVADNALTYINADDTILVQGGSSTVFNFLHAAASKKRKFTVFVVDGGPNNAVNTRNQLLTGSSTINPLVKDDELTSQERLTKPLAALGITVLMIPSSAVFSIMSYVKKVFLAPHAVLSNGGLIACVGASTIASAARAHKVPVMSLSGIYKLSPRDSFDPTSLREIGAAGALGGSEEEWEGVQVVNPLWDYVLPEKVNLYITNL